VIWGIFGLAVFCAGLYLFMVRPAMEALIEDQRDIKNNGVPATGVIKSVRKSTNRGATQWIFSVEFEAAGHTKPTVFEFAVVTPWLRSPMPALVEGESVAIHYREKWPSLAVIDALVK
jgi:hypothetical protein